jgi:uncharacterized membrane protein
MRKRIVINLDAPPGGASQRGRTAGTRRRWPRVLAILASLVLVIIVIGAVGGFIWWRHYQTTPAYTLTLLIDAAQRDDIAEFQKRIDDEEIAKNMVASISQKAAARYGFALSGPIQERIDAVMPSLLPRLKQTVHDEVVKEIKEFAAKSDQRSLIFLIVAVPSLVTVTTEGNVAKAKAPMSDRMIELTMKRDAERWKVTDFKDDVMVQRIVDSVMKELPAIGSIDSSSPLLKKPTRANRARRRR